MVDDWKAMGKSQAAEGDDSNRKSELLKTGDQYSIKYIAGDLNSDLYALPTKKQPPGPDDKIKECTAAEDVDEEEGEEKGKQEDVEGIEEKDVNKDLPPGWEKHEDNDGPYYWHIKSGTIQREPPLWPKDAPKELKTPVISPNPSPFLVTMRNHNHMSTSRNFGRMGQDNHVLSVTRSNTSMALDQDDERRRKEELAYK